MNESVSATMRRLVLVVALLLPFVAGLLYASPLLAALFGPPLPVNSTDQFPPVVRSTPEPAPAITPAASPTASKPEGQQPTSPPPLYAVGQMIQTNGLSFIVAEPLIEKQANTMRLHVQIAMQTGATAVAVSQSFFAVTDSSGNLYSPLLADSNLPPGRIAANTAVTGNLHFQVYDSSSGFVLIYYPNGANTRVDSVTISLGV